MLAALQIPLAGRCEAISTNSTHSQPIACLLAEFVKRQDQATMGASLSAFRVGLSDADEDSAIVLDDLPVKTTNGEPAVINAEATFYAVANQINHVDRV